MQDRIKTTLGVALLVAASAIVAKAWVQGRRGSVAGDVRNIGIRPLPTVCIGLIGGLVVGMTSVGSGSLIIVMLLILYPSLTAGQLVGTDLVQAIPLVASAAIGHLLFGDFQFDLTTSLLVGSLPGVYIGARMSSRAPDRVIRPALVVVLVLSGLKLVGASNMTLGVALALALAGAVAMAARSWRRSSPAGDSDAPDRQVDAVRRGRP